MKLTFHVGFRHPAFFEPSLWAIFTSPPLAAQIHLSD